MQAADQEAQAQLAFSMFGARAWCKLQIKSLKPIFAFSTDGVRAWFKLQIDRLKPNSRFPRIEQGTNQEAHAQLAFPTFGGEGLVQPADQEVQAQLAFSARGAKAWCKLQIKRLRPNSRFQRMG